LILAAGSARLARLAAFSQAVATLSQSILMFTRTPDEVATHWRRFGFVYTFIGTRVLKVDHGTKSHEEALFIFFIFIFIFGAFGVTRSKSADAF
jgi:hypothetical protein